MILFVWPYRKDLWIENLAAVVLFLNYQQTNIQKKERTKIVRTMQFLSEITKSVRIINFYQLFKMLRLHISFLFNMFKKSLQLDIEDSTIIFILKHELENPT